MVEWSLVEQLDQRIQQFIGLGATDQQIRRLLDNWHIVAALAGGRLTSCFEEFVPMQREEGTTDVDWDTWEEKLRHFPVTIDYSTTLQERLVRAAIRDTLRSVEPFIGVANNDVGVQTLRLKVIRNRKPVTDTALSALCKAKILVTARLPHMLEFAAQHPDSVPVNLLSTGSRQYLGDLGVTACVEIPCIRKAIVEDGGRAERMALMTQPFKNGSGGIEYPARQTFLVIRYPLKRDEAGKLLKEQ